MRGLALAAALALPGAALAQNTASDVRAPMGYAWFVSPTASSGAAGSIRVITEPGRGRAALTLNQVDAYQRAYRLYLGRFGTRMPIGEAEARARRAAWDEVLGSNEVIRVRDLTLRPLVLGTQP